MLIWRSLDKEFWQLFVGRAWDLWQWAWWNRGLKKRGACRRAQASMFIKESCVALMSGFLNESMTAVRKIYGKELGIWYSDTVAMFKCFLKLQPSLYLIKCKFGTPLLRIADHGVTICNNNVSIGVSTILINHGEICFSHFLPWGLDRRVHYFYGMAHSYGMIAFTHYKRLDQITTCFTQTIHCFKYINDDATTPLHVMHE